MQKYLLFLFSMSIFTSGSSQVEIIGHRGSSYLAPENTIASARLAWEEGADAVEVDIYLTKDKKIVCSHDANTKRTSGQDFIIADTESGILRKVDVGSFKDKKYADEKIPFLTEITRTVPEGKELVIEIKCKGEILPYLKKVIRENDRKRKYVFICFDFQTISETKKVFRRNACYWLCSNKQLLDENFENAARAGLDGVSLGYAIISENTMERAKNSGLKVYAWTVDDPAEAKRLIALGVKGITTNRPGWMKEQIGLR